jgi:hypothetical protein
MTGTTFSRRFAILPLLVLGSGCGDDGPGKIGIHARGGIDAYGWTDTSSMLAHYAKLDDESCEVLDGRSECVLVRCDEEAAPNYEDAGEVTVAGDALEIDEYNSYVLVGSGALVPGEELEMRASGSSAVPKHAGSVVIPERAELTSELADILVLDPTQDFVITWTPVESDRVVFRVAFGNASDEFSIECTTSGMFGQITVAARLVDALPAASPGVFSITNENLVEKTVEGWRIWFGAHQVILDGSAEISPAP